MNSLENLYVDSEHKAIFDKHKNKLLSILLLGGTKFQAFYQLRWIVDILRAFLQGRKCYLKLKYRRFLSFRSR
jgi:hypothetical protein